MLVAFVKNDLIETIKSVTDEEYSAIAPAYQVAIDISEMTPIPEVGWKFNGVAFENLSGIQVDRSKRITKLALRNRLTMAEKVLLEQVMSTNPTLKAWYRDYEASAFIDLARIETIQGLQYLEAAGLLSAGRANQILNNPITAEERWY